MDMRKLPIVLLAGLCLAASAGAQQVEYVTRGSVGGHAIRFGSNPIRATLPKAYVRVNNAPHAVRGASRPLDARLPIRLVRVHGTDHVIPTVAVDLVSRTAPAASGQQPARVQAAPKPERPAPSRHALMVHALMQNKLECHP